MVRRGIVYAGEDAWTGVHHTWSGRVRRKGLDGAGPETLAALDAGCEAGEHPGPPGPAG